MAESSRWRRAALVGLLAVFVVASVPGVGIAGAKGSASVVEPQVAYLPPDIYEPDDTFEDAYHYDPKVDGNTFSSYRTFHGMNAETDDNNDFVAITVEETGTPIWVETMHLSGFYDTEIYLYDEAESQLQYFDDNDFWDSTYSESMYYVAPQPGVYYVEVRGRDNLCDYELHITVGNARRIWGSNRYATAAEVSRLQWDNTQNPNYGEGYGPDAIVIANGHNPADALAGGALAAQLDGVLLLTHKDYLPWETWSEIDRVSESLFWDEDDVVVYILGGESAVSEDVYWELAGMKHVTHVHRIAGGSRYETAAMIADVTADEGWLESTAFVVNGSSWPDALAVAPVAAYNYSAVLMTRKDSVPAATMDWLNDNGITDVVIVGGETVVSDAVFDELDALYTVERVAGGNRYETAREVALWGVDNAGMEGQLATLVSGERFADALSAAPISWWTGGPVLLTRKSSLHSTVADYFDASGTIGYDHNDGIGCYVLGGPSVISEATYAAFRDHWKALLK